MESDVITMQDLFVARAAGRVGALARAARACCCRSRARGSSRTSSRRSLRAVSCCAPDFFEAETPGLAPRPRRRLRVRRPLVLARLAAAAALPAAAAAAGSRHAASTPAGYPTIDVTVVTSSPAARAASCARTGRRSPASRRRTSARRRLRARDRPLPVDGRRGDPRRNGRRPKLRPREAPDTQIEVLAFGRRAVELTGMSSATIDADQSLGTHRRRRETGTALWDAVILGSHALQGQSSRRTSPRPPHGRRRYSSRSPIDDAIAAAREAASRSTRSAIGAPILTRTARRLARETGGSYHPRHLDRLLHRVYASIGLELERTWHLSYPTTARPGDTATLDATVSRPRRGAARPRHPGVLRTAAGDLKPSTLIPTAAYDHGFGTLVAHAHRRIRHARRLRRLLRAPAASALRRRLDPHVGAREDRQEGDQRERLAAADGLLNATDRAFARRSASSRSSSTCSTAPTFRCARSSCSTSASAPAFVPRAPPRVRRDAVDHPPARMALCGFVARRASSSFKARRRLRTIEDQLPDLLITLAASLKAGHSFRQGIAGGFDEDSDRSRRS